MSEEEGEAPLSEPIVQQENTTPLASKSSSTTSTLSIGHDDFLRTVSSSISVLGCPCGNNMEDGMTVQCMKCSACHHAKCVGVDVNNLTETYLCKNCKEQDQEDSIDVVMNEPPSPTQETLVPYTGPISKSPKKKKSTTRKHLSTSSRSSSPISISMTEISENILDNNTLYLIDALKQELLRKNFATRSSDMTAPYRNINFEFSDAIRMEHMQDLETALKPVEVKELFMGKTTRFAVYATEAIDPGLLVTEYLGQIRLVDNLLPDSKKGIWVPQTFVLFPNAPRNDAWWETDEDLTLLAIDARKYGNLARYIRRSCRPNMSVKVVCVGVGETATIHFVLASNNVIAAGEELCLPLDFGDPYNDGLFFYDCACSHPDLCLSPYAKRSTTTSVKKLHTNFKTETESTKSAPASFDPNVNRKLSREERKMQRYIEFFEKMDRIEQKKESRKSGETSSGSKSRRGSTLATGGGDTITESSSSPPPPKRRSLGTARKTVSPATKSAPQSPLKEPINPKKAWLKTAQQSLSQPPTPIVYDNDDLIDVVGESLTTPVIPKTRKVTQKRKPEIKPEPPSPIVKSPEEPGEIVVVSPPTMTRPIFDEDLSTQPSPPPFPQKRTFEPPHLEDRYTRINRPSLIDDRHSHHTFTTSPDRRPFNFTDNKRLRRGDEPGFEQRHDRRPFDHHHRRFHDEQQQQQHSTRHTSTTGTMSNTSSPGQQDTFSYQQKEHRFPPNRNPQQQQQYHNRPPYTTHPSHQNQQRKRAFGRDEEFGRGGGGGRDYDELPSQHRNRHDGQHRGGQSPPTFPRRQFNEGFMERRSPFTHPRSSLSSQDYHRSERNNRFDDEMPSRTRHPEDYAQSESPQSNHPRGGGTRDPDRHPFNAPHNNDSSSNTRQQ